MAEQPLETWVSDSLDKPDMDEAGNDPLTQAEKLQAMALAQDQADLNAMKTAHQAALAHQKGQQADLAAQQKRDHADQAHQQKLAHQEQKHADARRAAREATRAQKGGGNGG
jgi:hypothetical protein